VEEREADRASDEDEAGDTGTATDALAARTRALIEESRALLQRLEQLIEHDHDDWDPPEAPADP
jgi:hypothetical protein